MPSRHAQRLAWLTGLLGLVAIIALPSLGARQQTLVRGNAPGEWRYWGADAWSTRYSPLDQINATNFNSLQVAWKWNAATDGEDEYYRTTPLYANGRLFTVATTHRYAYAIDPGDRHDAVVVEDWRKASAGRRRRANSPAADSPTGPTAAATSASSS